MLKNVAVTALCALLAQGSEDGEKFSKDATDSTDGFGASIWQESGVPNIVFYNLDDTGHNVYCLEFKEFFEAQYWNSSSDFEEVADKEVEFSDKQWTYELNNDSTDASWDYRVSNSESPIEDWIQTLKFTFRGEEVVLSGESVDTYALKFDIDVSGYVWDTAEGVADDHKFVIEFKLDECDDTHGSEDEDSDESVDSVDELSFHRLQRKFVRRRLGSGSNSDDGVSSDDSNEVDINHAFFTVEPVATDGAGEDVNVKLAFDGSDNKIYVVFDKFEDEVHLDPTAGVDTQDSANAVSVAASLLFTLLAAAFA